MEDRQINKIKRYLNDLIEEGDYLVRNTQKVINDASLYVNSLLQTEAPSSKKEALLTHLTKAILLITELNHSLLEYNETNSFPIVPRSTEASKERLPLESATATPTNIQDLNDYLKPEFTTNSTDFNFSTNDPKVPNIQAQNDSYIRKPLDDTVLKIICSNLINSNDTKDDNIVASVTSENSLPQVPDTSNRSATLTPSTVGSVSYQHPLIKYPPATDIPAQYDNHNIEQIKENMKYFSHKLGLNSRTFAEIRNEYKKDVPSNNFVYEEPVRDIKEETLFGVNDCEDIVECQNMESGSGETEYKEIKLNNIKSTPDPCSVPTGPPPSTGAIRKQKPADQDLIEFSCTNSDSESCEKVNTWLKNNPLQETAGQTLNTKNTAIEKLDSIKRFDRHEDVRDKVRKAVPDMKFVPEEIPRRIRNDLKADISDSPSKTRVKDFNKETISYEIKKMEIPKVNDICAFSHIVSPSEFYLHVITDSNASHLDKVSNYLEEKFRKTSSPFTSKKDAFDDLGKFCYGYVWGKRQAWYRLQVLDWKLESSSEEVIVQALDYGFTCSTRYTFLRKMTRDLYHISMLAIRCHLPFLYPPNSTYLNRLTEWPAVTIEAFQDIVKFGSDHDFELFEIVFAMLDGESVAVELAQCAEPDADTLGQILISSGLALEIGQDYEDHPELGEFLEDIDELENAENLNELVLGYDAKDEARICRFTRKDGSCYKGKNCKLEHVPLKDYTTDTHAIYYRAINDLIFPCKGEIVQVLITAYIDSCTYLAQIIRNPVTKQTPGIKMDKDMSDLMDSMNHPKLIAKYETFKIYPALGEIILGFHALSKKWMRATVVGDLKYGPHGNPKSIEVYAVDFGEQFDVLLKDIRVMKEEFMHLPFQVVKIYLDSYQHKKNCDQKKAQMFFKNHIFYRCFLANIRSSEPPFKVSLTTLKGHDIGPTLIKEGFAEKRVMDLYIADIPLKRRGFDLY